MTNNLGQLLERELITQFETERTKGKGCMNGAKYKPYINTYDFHSKACRYRVQSLRYGRLIHLLSSGEYQEYLRLESNPSVVELYEQFPLDPKLTLQICDDFGVYHPGYKCGGTIMTTDFLLRLKDDSGNTHLEAVQIKRSREGLTTEGRKNTLLAIEQEYFRRRNIPWKVVLSENFNQILSRNMALLYPFRNMIWNAEVLKGYVDDVMNALILMPAQTFHEVAVRLSSAGDTEWPQKLKTLCALKILIFPIKNKMIYDCRMDEFRMAT